ncbi:hypothetical protein AN391_02974 [Pseudoalteromonas sp. P1-13-1a]|nr:hypothetical protein AN391_02974 [Pseudoalteromonas sp. P1-13-1a]
MDGVRKSMTNSPPLYLGLDQVWAKVRKGLKGSNLDLKGLKGSNLDLIHQGIPVPADAALAKFASVRLSN